MDELLFAKERKTHLDCTDWLDWEHKEVMAMVLFSMALFLGGKIKASLQTLTEWAHNYYNVPQFNFEC